MGRKTGKDRHGLRRREGVEGGEHSPSKGVVVEIGKQQVSVQGVRSPGWGPAEEAWNPSQVHRLLPWGMGQAGVTLGGGGAVLTMALPSAGARTPASPARCPRAPCQPLCLCVCASSTGAVCAATSPSTICRTPSSRPSVPVAALSGETADLPHPRLSLLSGPAGGLTGLPSPAVAAGPSPWLASVSTWCRMCPWLCTTLAGSPR